MSSLDSQLYQWWLHEEAAIERDKKDIDVSCHHRRAQMILLETWRHTAEFVDALTMRSFSSAESSFRLPISLIHQLADRTTQTYWTMRPFDRNPVQSENEKPQYPSKCMGRRKRVRSDLNSSFVNYLSQLVSETSFGNGTGTEGIFFK